MVASGMSSRHHPRKGSANVAVVDEPVAELEVGDGQEATIWRAADGTTGWSAGAAGWSTLVSGEGDPPVGSVPAGTLVVGQLPPGAASVDLRADKPVDEIV